MKQTSFKALKLAAIITCMLAAGICYSCSMGSGDTPADGMTIQLAEGASAPELSEKPSEYSTEPAGNMAEDRPEKPAGVSPGEEAERSDSGVTGDDALKADQPLVYVHVCGLVCSPGVYGLPEGSRVYEAIEAAGGYAENAAPDYLNLAEVLEDGMKLQVPDQSQADQWQAQGLNSVTGGKLTQDNGQKVKVNLNKATKEELMSLRGIGESRAEDIIRYRDTFGGFKTIEDIMNVSGIKDAAFDKIKDSITV